MSWRVVASSVEGVSHIESGVPCQDAHGHRLMPNDTLLAAIADGAGSARLSQEGARRAVATCIESLAVAVQDVEHWSQKALFDALLGAFSDARSAIVAVAASESQKISEFATTLTCAVVTPDWLAVGQIGDGMAITRADGGPLSTVTHPHKGRFVNETQFLTRDHALEYVDIIVRRQRIRQLALSTDGLVNVATFHPDYRPSRDFFSPLFSFATKATNGQLAEHRLGQLLRSDRISKGTTDDKTLLVAIWVDADLAEDKNGTAPQTATQSIQRKQDADISRHDVLSDKTQETQLTDVEADRSLAESIAPGVPKTSSRTRGVRSSGPNAEAVNHLNDLANEASGGRSQLLPKRVLRAIGKTARWIVFGPPEE